MARYRMHDGTVIDTANASQSWEERREWDGHNRTSVHAGRFGHEKLYRSRKGRYYIEKWTDWQGNVPSCEWVSPEEAARWLLLNEDELPEDLAHLEATIME